MGYPRAAKSKPPPADPQRLYDKRKMKDRGKKDPETVGVRRFHKAHRVSFAFRVTDGVGKLTGALFVSRQGLVGPTRGKDRTKIAEVSADERCS